MSRPLTLLLSAVLLSASAWAQEADSVAVGSIAGCYSMENEAWAGAPEAVRDTGYLLPSGIHLGTGPAALHRPSYTRGVMYKDDRYLMTFDMWHVEDDVVHLRKFMGWTSAELHVEPDGRLTGMAKYNHDGGGGTATAALVLTPVDCDE